VSSDPVPRIFVVDDEYVIASTLAPILQKSGPVHVFPSLNKFLVCCRLMMVTGAPNARRAPTYLSDQEATNLGFIDC
jgi:hypothetical protein